MDVCKAIVLAEEDSGEKAPCAFPELVRWLDEKKVLGPHEHIDRKAGVIRDIWGAPLVLLTRNAQLAGVASKGPDGQWESGHGDDLLLWLDRFRHRESRDAPGTEPE
jgi:hypothetical protein